MAYSKAQTKQADKTDEFVGRTKEHWASVNSANSKAQLQQGVNNYNGANQVMQEYGPIWAQTTGVTGSDQTGASVWGYRNAGNHVVNQTDFRQAEEKIRSQIADGGLDVIGHALAARGLSGGKTLDSYNKFLEYSATGQISEDNTLTPGVYSKIVDDAIAEYLTKQYGSKASNIYNKVTEIFDDVASVGLGAGLGIFKSAIDTAGESLDRARQNGANDQQAVTHGFGAGLSDAVGSMAVEIGKNVDSPIKNEIARQLDKLSSNVKKPVEEGVTAGTALLVENITKGLLNKGFSRNQAEKILKYEMSKIQDYGQEITVGALQSVAKKLLK